MEKRIKLFDVSINQKEQIAVNKVLKSKFWASGSGIGKVAEFEKKFTDYTDSDNCVAVNNGTAALHLALSLSEIKTCEVILPSLSFVSTAHSIIYNGGKPIFVDINPETLCIDPENVEKALTKKTKVILPVHFGGTPCDLTKLTKIAKNNDLDIIEDAAHAAGSSYGKKKIGSHSKAVCFSFHPVKNLAMPSGGAINLNGKKAKEMKKILHSKRWCGITNRKGPSYDVKNLGWNFYMNEISAAIGIEQLKKLDKMNNIRKKIAKRYSKEIKLENKMKFSEQNNHHLYWIIIKNREQFMSKMNEKNIETGIHYSPIHKMSMYKNSKKLKNTENIAKNIVSLPIHPNLLTDDVTKIIDSVNLFSK